MRTSLKPLSTILSMMMKKLERGSELSPMMPRGTSPSERCTPNRSRFSPRTKSLRHVVCFADYADEEILCFVFISVTSISLYIRVYFCVFVFISVYSCVFLCNRVYFCVFVCISVYSCVFLCIRVYFCIFVCISVYSCVFLYIRMYFCVFVCISVYSCLFLCISVYFCVFVCIRVYFCVFYKRQDC